MDAINLDNLISQLGEDFSTQKLPPLDQWNPSLSGNMDMVIRRDGRWFHEGVEIKRQKLVNLFSRILCKEGNNYFLVSPVEKWKIAVEDVPFQVIDLQVLDSEGTPILIFKTSTDDSVILNRKNPLRVEIDSQTGEPSPYLVIRDGMEGRLNRNTYYQLVELARQLDSGEYVVSSCGENFVVG